MKFFFRAILLSLRYKWSILGSVLCSVLIALLWSASITTIFPFIKIVFEEQGTMETMIAKQIEDQEFSIQTLQEAIAELDGTLPDNSPDEAMAIQDAIEAKQTQLYYERKKLTWLTDVAQPMIIKYAPKSSFMTLVIVIAWLLFATVLKGVFLVISTVLVARIANRTIYDMRRMYFLKAMEIDQMRVDRIGTSKLMTHLSHNMSMISGGISAFYGKAIREPLKMIACLVVAAWICLPLLIISLVLVPIGALLIHSLARRMKKATKKEIGGMANVFQSLIESFSAIKTVRMFNREQTERRRFKKNAGTLYRMVMRMSFYDSLIRPCSEVLGIASISIAMLAGAYLVLEGQTDIFNIPILKTKMDAGMLVLFYAMLAGASDPVRKMTEIVNQIVRAGTACENLFRTFDQEPVIAVPENPLPVPVHSQSIEFKNVTFGYFAKQPVVQNFNCKIPFGQTVAIVGGNGSGKSTIVNLLARFYEPNRGVITIDDIPLKRMRPRKVRQQMAWVTQDSVLFRGTVRENIEYGIRNVTPADLEKALQISGVNRFLDQLPNGLDTDIGDRGKLLSAGQRQRVAIARAVIADPRILILDEATSQLDGQNEAIIHDLLKGFLRGRTTILITHRVSSLQLADRVIVMDGGKIVGDSTPDAASSEIPQFNFLFSKSA